MEMAAKENRSDVILAKHCAMIERYEALENCVAAVCGEFFPVSEDKADEVEEEVLEFFPEEV